MKRYWIKPRAFDDEYAGESVDGDFVKYEVAAKLEQALRDCIDATHNYTVHECNEVRRIAKAALNTGAATP